MYKIKRKLSYIFFYISLQLYHLKLEEICKKKIIYMRCYFACLFWLHASTIREKHAPTAAVHDKRKIQQYFSLLWQLKLVKAAAN